LPKMESKMIRRPVVLEGEAWNPLHGDAELYHNAAGLRGLVSDVSLGAWFPGQTHDYHMENTYRMQEITP
jgi:hypothetical protein